jgi:toxin FitB
VGKTSPDTGVAAWLAEADEDRVFISVITLAELRHRIDRLSAGVRRDRLDTWLNQQVPARFEARVLLVDAETTRSHAPGIAIGRKGVEDCRAPSQHPLDRDQ